MQQKHTNCNPGTAPKRLRSRDLNHDYVVMIVSFHKYPASSDSFAIFYKMYRYVSLTSVQSSIIHVTIGQ